MSFRRKKKVKKIGSRRSSRRNSKLKCKKYKQKDCGSADPNCDWDKYTGCFRKNGIFYGPVRPIRIKN